KEIQPALVWKVSGDGTLLTAMPGSTKRQSPSVETGELTGLNLHPDHSCSSV
ncbi:hypothetical protein GOODEAATRI_026206, partial [Goodea atripinnis]